MRGSKNAYPVLDLLSARARAGHRAAAKVRIVCCCQVSSVTGVMCAEARLVTQITRAIGLHTSQVAAMDFSN